MDWMDIYSTLSAIWVAWFAALFVGIVVWTYWPSRIAEIERRGRIPFSDEK